MLSMTRVQEIFQFLNGITDSFLAQSKSLDANHNKYSANFDATTEDLMNHISHQKIKQCLILLVLAVVSLRSSRPRMTRARISICLLSIIHQTNGLSFPLSKRTVWECIIYQEVALGMATVVIWNTSMPIISMVPRRSRLFLPLLLPYLRTSMW